MFCNKCGAALPSRGYICKSCGAMMSKEHIQAQKEFNLGNKRESNELVFLSDKFSKEPINRDYGEKPRENKWLGVLFIVVVLIVLIIFAILKVMQ